MTLERKTHLRHDGDGRAVHDVGGMHFGAIDREEHDLALWERRIDAMLILLVGPRKGAFTVDAMRRVIEDYGEQAYDSTTYYEKWIRAVRNLLIEQEVLTQAEVEARIEALRVDFAAAGRAISSDGVPYP